MVARPCFDMWLTETEANATIEIDCQKRRPALAIVLASEPDRHQQQAELKLKTPKYIFHKTRAVNVGLHRSVSRISSRTHRARGCIPLVAMATYFFMALNVARSRRDIRRRRKFSRLFQILESLWSLALSENTNQTLFHLDNTRLNHLHCLFVTVELNIIRGSKDGRLG